jgi:hypothetical protein
VDDGAAAVHGYGARLLRPLIAHVSCSCSAALCLVIRSSLRPVVCPSVCVNEMMERGVRCVCAPWSGLCALVPTAECVRGWTTSPLQGHLRVQYMNMLAKTERTFTLEQAAQELCFEFVPPRLQPRPPIAG